jgi:hypothetical protein
VIDMVNQGRVKLLINTETPGSINGKNGFQLRRYCIEHGIPTITSLDTLVAVVECLERDLKPQDLTPCEISEFAAIVAQTRHQDRPANELPMNNTMLKK